MVSFSALIQKFKDKGEKTGWTYLCIPATIANKLQPNTKVSFRVKGTVDNYAIKQVSLLPIGEGDFIMALNATLRKAIKKPIGDKVKLTLQVDTSQFIHAQDFMLCLADDPKASANFEKLPPSHQKYYSKWIDAAKTPETKIKRITQSIQGLAMGLSYGEMVRYFKEKKPA